MTVGIGTPVTVYIATTALYPARHEYVARATVSGLLPGGERFVARVIDGTAANYNVVHKLADEGMYWARGHDSRTRRALEVACALGGST